MPMAGCLRDQVDAIMGLQRSRVAFLRVGVLQQLPLA